MPDDVERMCAPIVSSAIHSLEKKLMDHDQRAAIFMERIAGIHERQVSVNERLEQLLSRPPTVPEVQVKNGSRAQMIAQVVAAVFNGALLLMVLAHLLRVTGKG